MRIPSHNDWPSGTIVIAIGMDDDVGIAGRLAAFTVGTPRNAEDGIGALGDDICIEPLDEDIDID